MTTSMLGAPMVVIRALTKSYGDNEVLRGIDIEVAEREVVCVIGPSGSGKSTLLRCVNRLEEPTSGTISVDGVEVCDPKCDLDKVRTAMGMVFQQFNLFPHKSAAGNVTLALTEVLKLDKATANERAKEMLERVGLGDRMDHNPTELSGGQMQRVAIARALVNRPAIILADEPTGNLDSASGHAIADLFGELHAAGQTIVMITHDHTLARIASRSLHIRDGEIVEDKSVAA